MTCLGEIARRAEQAPDAHALLAPGHPAISFTALAASIAGVARVLRKAGVRPGDVVAIAMPEGPGLLTTLLGAMEVAAAAPMDWQLTEDEFRSRLKLLPACALIVRSNTAGHGAVVARNFGIPVIEVDFAADGEVLLEPEAPLNVSHDRSCASGQCALVLQTSATTGEPKLVPLTHTNLYAICSGQQQGLALHAKDRYLSIMPLHHILGFSSAVGQLMAGGSVACAGFDAQRFAAWVEELRPSWYSAGPALHQAILEIAKPDTGPFRRSPLRFVRCGSGAGSQALLADLERVLQVNVVNGYGLTEAGPVTNTPPHLSRKPGSVGRTIGPEIGIMDAGGALLGPELEGEVVLRGDAVMDGYLDAEEANREVFRDGWFRTGDLGRMDTEGDLFITGRIKEVINRGGETISPLEIDLAISEHAAIFRSATFAVPHPTLGDDIVAAVVLRPGVKTTASDVRRFLTERLSRSKIPSRIWFTESIPVSASGKPLRNALRTRFLDSAKLPEAQESLAVEDESTASLRRHVGEIWMRVLDSDFPDAEDNFFAMGGDSLSAARLFALLEAEFQLDELEPAQFFDSPTFFQLVAVVAGRLAHGGSAYTRFENVSALCLQPSGDGPPLFFFPGEGVEVWALRHLARHLGDQQPFYALRHNITDAAEFSDFARRFVTLISRIQPAGPIVLVGHCYGGILAYEVAQRLVGEPRAEVSVVLIDVATPGYPKPQATSYLNHLPGAMRALLRGEGPKLAADVAEHFRFIRALRRGKKNAQEASGASLNTALSPGAVVLRTYVPRPFPGPLANALAGGLQVSARVLEDSRKGWRDFARGPLQEGFVPGQHNSIFDAENAPALADFIRSAIRIPARSGPAVL